MEYSWIISFKISGFLIFKSSKCFLNLFRSTLKFLFIGVNNSAKQVTTIALYIFSNLYLESISF